MIEILALFVMGRLIYQYAEDRDLPGWAFVLVLLALWIGCEFIGILLGLIFGPPGIGMLLGIYMLSMIGAACGASISFLIVGLWPRRPVFDRHKVDLNPDDFFKSKKPRRKRRRRDEDYEDDEEDDDDDPPPRRSRSRDEGYDDRRVRRRRDD